MNFDWLRYLTLAKEMMDKVNEFADQEAVYRSVVSRAYYAVFCSTRNYVREVDGKEFYGNDHQSLQRYLIAHSHRSRKKLGNQLRTLHQHRIKADYQGNLDEKAISKASRAVALAQEIADNLGKIFS